MNLSKTIERATKAAFLAPRTLLRYGTLRPSRAKLTGCDNWIYIDPNDRRAIKKFVNDPIRKRVSPPLTFWRDFLAKLEPAVAIDVGVNYGECIFGARYVTPTRVYGFEANPRLAPYLQRSRSEHPESECITVIEGLVSDTLEDAVAFYADPGWSGTGSAVRSLNDSKHLITSSIPSRTIDSVIPCEQVAGKSLLFKMDIEGYESRAFGGFWETLDAAALVVGFVEFDTTYIRESGADPEAYYASLAMRFDIHRLHDGKPDCIVMVNGFGDLPTSRAIDERVHTDLLLSTRGIDPTKWLPAHWSILSSKG
jgi:FkbM family methyltransferase